MSYSIDSMLEIMPGTTELLAHPGEASITIARKYRVSALPVLWDEYEAARVAPARSARQGFNRCAMGASWRDAIQFCNRLSLRQGLCPAYSGVPEMPHWDRTANGYRLLTEAELNYAVRQHPAVKALPVDEWVWDRYSEHQPAIQVDYAGPDQGATRVVYSRSYSPVFWLRPAYSRCYAGPTYATGEIYFRIAQSNYE